MLVVLSHTPVKLGQSDRPRKGGGGVLLILGLGDGEGGWTSRRRRCRKIRAMKSEEQEVGISGEHEVDEVEVTGR